MTLEKFDPKVTMKPISQRNFQEFLVQISDCFIDQNLSGWRNSIILPFSMVTASSTIILIDDVEVATNFEHYLQACQIMKIDQIIRVDKSLEDCRDGTWIGTYETHLISRGMRATKPNTSSILMNWEQGRIKATGILNARGTSEWVQFDAQ